ncbi:MAG: hypothetical protein OXF02_02585 [Simkaniaceae bacterium]|nr:hypothetical protein [Simkaniaceae bacterium]
MDDECCEAFLEAIDRLRLVLEKIETSVGAMADAVIQKVSRGRTLYIKEGAYSRSRESLMNLLYEKGVADIRTLPLREGGGKEKPGCPD